MDEATKACPCLHIAPCRDNCTCVHPLSSAGCGRCCSYGSPDHQRAMALRLAGLIDRRRDIGAEVYRLLSTSATGIASPRDDLYRCGSCDPSFGCWDGEARCSKLPPFIPEQILELANKPATDLKEFIGKRVCMGVRIKPYFGSCDLEGGHAGEHVYTPPLQESDGWTCKQCGCTQDDCSLCIARTGSPCTWAAANLCTACVSHPPIWMDMDGMLHLVGGHLCGCNDRCPNCGMRWHAQGIYHGMMYSCEKCHMEWRTDPLPVHEGGVIDHKATILRNKERLNAQ